MEVIVIVYAGVSDSVGNDWLGSIQTIAANPGQPLPVFLEFNLETLYLRSKETIFMIGRLRCLLKIFDLRF